MRNAHQIEILPVQKRIPVKISQFQPGLKEHKKEQKHKFVNNKVDLTTSY